MLAELIDGSSIAIEAIAIPVLMALTLGLGRFLKRRSVDLGLFYQLFCIAFAIWLPLEILHTEFPHRLGTMRALRAANVLLGTFFILALVRRYYWELWFEKHQHAKAPKFLSQLFGLILFIVAVFIVIGGIYGYSIEGVVFGSTVVVGIVGFAMQDLLGNIIAGIALEIGKPFKTGDWLRIEQQHAEVIEVNWRSTGCGRTTTSISIFPTSRSSAPRSRTSPIPRASTPSGSPSASTTPRPRTLSRT